MKYEINLDGNFLIPYQSIIDINEQLPTPSSQLKHLSLKPVCELNTTNDWINLEALGKPAAIRAQVLTKYLIKQLKKQPVNALQLHIFIPGGDLTVDNLYVFLFLADLLDQLELTFYVDCDKRKALQESTSFLKEKSNTLIIFTDHDQHNNQPEFIEKYTSLKSKRYDFLKAYRFYFNDQWYDKTQISQENAAMLIGYAWVCMKTGAYQLACRALAKALELPLDEQPREQLFIQLQVIRFLSHQYDMLACEPFPNAFKFIDEKEAKSIYFLKAYAATLSRNLDIAAQYFQICNIDKDMPLSDEASLYQLNLHALYLVLKKEIHSAFTAELRIENYIKEHKIEVVGLKYVNFINIARLYKKTKAFDKALTYYEKAYNEIREGGYTTSDHIYYNMNLGSLYEAAEKPRTALYYWLKSAIHWLSAPNKYELSWRPRIILCQETISDVLKPLSIEKINQFFIDKITLLLDKSEMRLEASTSSSYQFVLDDNKELVNDACYISKNIILYGGKRKILRSNDRQTPKEAKLNELASKLIKTILNINDMHQTIAIDNNLDYIALESDRARYFFAALAQSNTCYYDGQLVSNSAEQSINPFKDVKISLSKIINQVTDTNDGIKLTYKRSFMNKILNDENEINVVKLLDKNNTFNLQELPDLTIPTLNQLLSKRVVTIHFGKI